MTQAQRSKTFAFPTACRPAKPQANSLLFSVEKGGDGDEEQRNSERHIDAALQLTTTEQNICALLVDVAAHLAANGKPVTLRIAGGWVRDKLLGLDSHDLDIALDSLMGFEFANHVNEFLTNQQHAQDLLEVTLPHHHLTQTAKMKIGSISKIDSNPDKSKHLETATTKLFGQMIDFVNLRTETYNDDSRIPVMEFGTPLQDALRRDITINALFYNLHTKKVEDFTGQGLLDLQNGHIRTPLPPLQTFIDDPLRILRVIRFASRFNFSIEPTILQVCLDHAEIRTALGTKISKERIGVEVDKMITTNRVNHALRAVRLIHEFGIASDILAEAPIELRFLGPEPVGSTLDPNAVFASAAAPGSASTSGPSLSPTTSFLDLAISLVPVDLVAGLRISETLVGLLDALSVDEIRSFVPAATGVPCPFTKDEHRLLFLCAMVSPYIGRKFLEKKKVMPAAKYVIMNSLKLSGTDGDWVSSMVVFIPQIQETVNQIYAQKQQSSASAFASSSSSTRTIATSTTNDEMDTSDSTPPSPNTTLHSRKSVGLFIRELGSRGIYTGCRPLGSKYVLAVFMAMVVEITQTLSLGQSTTSQLTQQESDSIVNTILEKYASFWQTVVSEHGVEGAWQLKNLVNGGEVAKFYGIKAGPAVGQVLQLMIEYQLENPGAGRDEIMEWLKSVDIKAF
ncbi:UNVERIFIED_CONTAM: CCA tRNA nucleotidyltransferase, mitochondrial [Siphonaria sp. JEL0065]|nr:CCA tRNA nucleotidyltransferase, mitochondrial [Siphonaria sp. JEL0065]